MRKKIIVGNWKMNMNRLESESFMNEINNIKLSGDVEYGVAPTFTSLGKVSEMAKGDFSVVAQNVYFEDKGAFTGEISIDMLKELNVKYIIVGHSERREIFKEDDSLINSKVKAIFDKNLNPILCVGETLDQRKDGKLVSIVTNQIKKNLEGVSSDNVKNLVIAYEPIWAIGTGVTATAEEAQDACKIIRKFIEKIYDLDTANSVRIQYGGSVKPENITEILSKDDIDGALVGGASLSSDSFSKLVNWK